MMKCVGVGEEGSEDDGLGQGKRLLIWWAHISTVRSCPVVGSWEEVG